MVKRLECKWKASPDPKRIGLRLATFLVALTPLPTHADGFVLVLQPDGSFVQSDTWATEARIAFSGRLPKQKTYPAPTRVVAPAEIAAAIRDAGFRYAGDAGVRAASLSAKDWVALFRANIEIESAYDPQAVSTVGALGLGQLMPETAKELGVDPSDMNENLDGSARYLAGLLGEFGTPELALAAYNAGPGAVRKYGGIPPYSETQGHVRKVMAVWSRIQKEGV